MALTPIQHIAVKYLSWGWSPARVAAELKLTPHFVRKWADEPEFQAALQQGVVHQAELVEALLLDGEARAAETLIDALKAEGVHGRPNWSARVTAAVTLLDRAGMRGKAIDRQQVAVGSVTRSAEATEVELRKALRDPGVRTWLKESGALAALNAGTEGPEAEEIEAVIEESPPPPQEGAA